MTDANELRNVRPENESQFHASVQRRPKTEICISHFYNQPRAKLIKIPNPSAKNRSSLTQNYLLDAVGSFQVVQPSKNIS